MDYLDKQRFIRQKATENRNDPEGTKVYWSRHAIAEMINDNLTRSEVEQALEACEIIEDYPTEHRPPARLFGFGKAIGNSTYSRSCGC